MESLVSTSAPRLLVLVLIYAAFVSMGLPDGMLGAAWPSMRAELEVGLNDNWAMLLLGACGASLSSFGSGSVLRRFGAGRVLVTTTTLTALVIGGYSLSPTLTSVTVLAFFLGLGNGCVDAGLNHFVSSTLSSRHMSWLHAFWGVGVSLGTVGITVAFATGNNWRSAYLAVGIVQFCLALAFFINLRRLPDAVPSTEKNRQAGAPNIRATFGLAATWLSMAAFFTYCGLECSAGLWIASVLHDGRGFSLEAVGSMTTLYWASLTVGRFAIGVIANRLPAIRFGSAWRWGCSTGHAHDRRLRLPLDASAGKRFDRRPWPARDGLLLVAHLSTVDARHTTGGWTWACSQSDRLSGRRGSDRFYPDTHRRRYTLEPLHDGVVGRLARYPCACLARPTPAA